MYNESTRGQRRGACATNDYDEKRIHTDRRTDRRSERQTDRQRDCHTALGVASRSGVTSRSVYTSVCLLLQPVLRRRGNTCSIMTKPGASSQQLTDLSNVFRSPRRLFPRRPGIQHPTAISKDVAPVPSSCAAVHTTELFADNTHLQDGQKVSYCTFSISSLNTDQFLQFFLPVDSVRNLLLNNMHTTSIISLHYLVKHKYPKITHIYRWA